MKQFERECITLVKSKLFNPHRTKYVREFIPLSLVHIDATEIIDSLDKTGWEVLNNVDPIMPSCIFDWIDRCRKISKKWFEAELPIYQLGFLWAGDGTGRFKVSYWLEYSIEKPKM